jgi:hypothetical protein
MFFCHSKAQNLCHLKAIFLRALVAKNQQAMKWVLQDWFLGFSIDAERLKK